MTQTNVIQPEHFLSDRENAAATTTPTLFEALNLYNGGTWIASRAAGVALTIPAGLPIGWRLKCVSDITVTTPATVTLDPSYVEVAPLGFGSTYTLIPGGTIELEVIATTAIGGSNRMLVTFSEGSVNSAFFAPLTVANRTTLSTITPAFRFDGMLAMVLSDNSLWRFNAASALAADYTGTVAIPAGAVTAANLVLVPADAPAAGRWIRADKAFTARIPFVQATANAAVLWTPPAGVVVRVTGLPFWNITAFTAGDGARRIGASASAGDGEFTAVGDLLGGTAGQLPVLGVTPGTVGDAFLDSDAANTSLATLQKLLMPPATGFSTLRYDIMAAGTDTADGMICIPVSVDMTVATIS